MMYVAYPETTAEERVAGLEPLDLSACCDGASLPEGPIESATIEMLAGRPVLRWIGTEGPVLAGLAGTIARIGEREAGRIAQDHMRHAFGTAPPIRVEPVEVDQWSLQQPATRRSTR